MKVSPAAVFLRPVEIADLPIFFAHQLDPESTRMAAFPSRQHEAFMKHWHTNILGNPANACRTIVCDGRVVGNVGAWNDAGTGERYLGYWLDREVWGRGIASAALSQFLQVEAFRPLHARVVKHNVGSIRVLEKSDFTCVGEETFTLPNGTALEELHYVLRV
ncbi:GNAT family N-acetyltransferase [Oleiharenicola lentus]|uniref:GNAT family N-acetyltransferase n=1 Tax=Oleiharenicola lentus TaxID=2508720 RepID=UPI003F677A93